MLINNRLRPKQSSQIQRHDPQVWQNPHFCVIKDYREKRLDLKLSKKIKFGFFLSENLEQHYVRWRSWRSGAERSFKREAKRKIFNKESSQIIFLIKRIQFAARESDSCAPVFDSWIIYSRVETTTSNKKCAETDRQELNRILWRKDQLVFRIQRQASTL